MDNFSSLKIENHYFPCINWFKNSIRFSNIELLSTERWQKMSFRNRCVVAGSIGLIHLSVPVVGGRNQKLLVKDVKIDYATKWQLQHWRTIVSCYNKAPYFEYFEEIFHPFFEKRYEFLFDLNRDVIQTIAKILNKNQLISVFSGHYETEDIPTLPYCLPKNFQLLPNPVQYTQVFEDRIGFQPNLSILDLLFSEGLNAKNLLLEIDKSL